jgi:fructose-1,6-bisphosphatase I
MAFLVEQAGGIATDGTQPITSKIPATLHDRTPLIVGSKSEVKRVLSFLND